MSLNRTLDRLFGEVRREAKRNPAFADRLDAVLRAHGSVRDVPEDLVAAAIAHHAAPDSEPDLAEDPVSADAGAQPAAPVAPLNPMAFLTREGADALRAELETGNYGLDLLCDIVAEHNLDPAGRTAGLDRPALIAHIVAQSRKRVERDRKLFDY